MNAWLKRRKGPDEVVQIIQDTECRDAVLVYQVYAAFEAEPDYLGRILFDAQGYWIYDGEILTITEQEQLARFIEHNMEIIWND